MSLCAADSAWLSACGGSSWRRISGLGKRKVSRQSAASVCHSRRQTDGPQDRLQADASKDLARLVLAQCLLPHRHITVRRHARSHSSALQRPAIARALLCRLFFSLDGVAIDAGSRRGGGNSTRAQTAVEKRAAWRLVTLASASCPLCTAKDDRTMHKDVLRFGEECGISPARYGVIYVVSRWAGCLGAGRQVWRGRSGQIVKHLNCPRSRVSGGAKCTTGNSPGSGWIFPGLIPDGRTSTDSARREDILLITLLATITAFSILIESKGNDLVGSDASPTRVTPATRDLKPSIT